jgi:hypothetical protein
MAIDSDRLPFAINRMVQNVPDVRKAIWTRPNTDFNPAVAEDHRLPSTHRLVARCALSLWNGNKTISLSDLVARLPPDLFEDVLEGLKLAYNRKADYA